MAPAPSSSDPVDASEEGGGRSESSQSRDVAWLSSLSESELDFLISLKEMVAMRAKNVGFSDLAEKFDVRMLRALGIILLENFKERVKGTTTDPKLVEMLALLSSSGMAAPDRESSSCSKLFVNDSSMPSFVTPRRKRMWDGYPETYQNDRTLPLGVSLAEQPYYVEIVSKEVARNRKQRRT